MPRRSDCLDRAVYRLLAIAACVAAGRPSAAEETAAARPPVVATRPVRPEPVQEFHLAYQFHAGQEVRLLLAVGSQIRVQKAQNVALNTIQSITERHYRVVSVDADGSAILDLVIDNVRIAYTINNNPVVAYDTRAGVLPPKGMEKVRECIGRHTRVRVDTRGRVSPLEGLQAASFEDPDFLVILPEKPVRIGQQWSDDYPARVQVTKELSQKITLRRRYTLSAVNNNVAVIRVETAEVTPINDPQVLAGMVQLTPKGTVLLDLGQGALTLRDLCCERTEVNVLGTASSIAGVSNRRETLR